MIAKYLIKLKGEFYHIAIRPVMLYDSECYIVKFNQEQKEV